MMKEIWSFAALLISLSAAAQYDKEVRSGNDLYAEGKYDEAEISYRKALDKEAEDKTAGAFNLGDALYKQGRSDEALAQYQQALNGSENKEVQSGAWHNIGNTYLQKMQQAQQNPQEAQQSGQYLDKAIDAYKNALRLNPKDNETRYNLAKALKEKQQQQNQDQQNQDNKDKQDQNKDQEQQNKDQQDKQDQENKDNKENQDQKDQQDQNKDQDQQNKDQQDKQDQKDQNGKQDPKEQDPNQQGKPRPNKMSREDAERLLKALEHDEEDLQEKMNMKRVEVQPIKTEKDW